MTKSILAGAILIAAISAHAAPTKAPLKKPTVSEAKSKDGRVPLKIPLPQALVIGTREPITADNLEPNATKIKRKPIMVPPDVKLISKGLPVKASDDEPFVGETELVSDGDKEGADGSYVEFAPGTQWVQLDLKKSVEIHAVVVWHYHQMHRVYKDVVIQVADDPDFITDIRTLFNNDHDNSSGLGVGKDKEYIETNLGRPIPGKGVTARYIRCYSNGNTSNDMNHYVEVEVYGRAVTAVPTKELPSPEIAGKKDGWSELKVKAPALECTMCFPSYPPSENLVLLPSPNKRPPVMVPRDVSLLSLKKPVRGSCEDPIIGTLEYVTDGDKRGREGSYVELPSGLQWVQIDLGARCEVYVIVLWHTHSRRTCYYRDVVIKTADDEAFSVNVKTVFNNDHNNSSGLGAGKDNEYIEDNYGRRIDAKGVAGRYVRLYSNGNSDSEISQYIEVEVHGRPITGKASTPKRTEKTQGNQKTQSVGPAPSPVRP